MSTILELIDPRTLLTTDDEIAAALATLAAFDAGGGVLPAGVSNARMWESLRIKEACIHPVTGEKLFWMGRMSAFVPMVREQLSTGRAQPALDRALTVNPLSEP